MKPKRAPEGIRPQDQTPPEVGGLPRAQAVKKRENHSIRSQVETLLSRLDGVKRTGANRWIGRCPAHEDRSPSLSIRELEDGRVLVHCFAECSVQDVLGAVGLEFDALFPDKAPADHSRPRERQPFNPADVLQCVAFEALIVSVAAATLAKGEPLTEENRSRLMRAASRLQGAAEVASHA